MSTTEETSAGELTFDDLLEFEARAERGPEPVAAQRHVSVERLRPEPKPAAGKRGRFYRPELHSSWERIVGNRVVQVAFWTLLLAATVLLVGLAMTRFAA
ncbi:hypothetical protein [Herbiconiux sp. YIM B11900]|uniref:hypothetical protein n=1 Tax=Herbiconiux sp. YIM B11900 TaxID=3404131 RepID=UPI003F869BAE